MLAILRRWADRSLREENARLSAEVEALERIGKVKDREIGELAAVVARNHARVQAEAAIAARQRADAEGNHGRTQ